MFLVRLKEIVSRLEKLATICALKIAKIKNQMIFNNDIFTRLSPKVWIILIVWLRMVGLLEVRKAAIFLVPQWICQLCQKGTLKILSLELKKEWTSYLPPSSGAVTESAFSERHVDEEISVVCISMIYYSFHRSWEKRGKI